MIKEVISGVTVDLKLQKKIYELISAPEQDIENISWRRDILSDFMRNNVLFEEFSRILNENDEISTNLRILVKSSASVFLSSTGKSAYGERDSAILKMRSLADILTKVLRLYMIAHDIFEKCRVYSELFVKLKSYLISIIKKPEFIALGDLSKKLSESLTLDTSYTILLMLDNWLRIEDSSLFKISSDPYDYNLKKGEKAENPYDHTKIEYIGFNDASDSQLQSLVERSTYRFSFLMEHIVTQLKIPFENLQEDLYFYRFALLLDRKLKSMKLPVCLPYIIEDENRFECNEIYDMTLALYLYENNKIPGEIIIPNDIRLSPDNGALIVTGKNNAGKTVFLRSIGIIQVFAQAGLPVPAKAATVSMVSGIYSYFSAMDVGQGRFEEEVSFISDILEVIKKGDLFLFNEVFQSTAYEEASDALCDVLAAISISGARSISVTHLPHIKENMQKLEKQYSIKRSSTYAEAETIGQTNTYKIIYNK